MFFLLQNQMHVYPPYFMSGVPAQGQRAYSPTMTSFRPWQGGPKHGRTAYGFVHNQRRPGLGPRTQMPRPSSQQRMGGGTRGGMDRMQQQQQQGSMPGQHVRNSAWTPNGILNVLSFSIILDEVQPDSS